MAIPDDSPLSPLRAKAEAQLRQIDSERWRRRAVVLVVLLLVGGFVLGRSGVTASSGPPPESYLPRAVPPSVTPTVAPVPGLKVHVAGAVIAPGVVELPAGSRAADAVVAAGGLADGADEDRLNLAAKLTDGQRLYVLRQGELVAPVASSGAEEATDGAPLSLNAATAKQLEELPGVGPATAAAIVAYRQQKGAFSSIDELGKVKGIGPAKLEQMRPLLTL